MSKILTDKELIDIIRRAPDEIDCSDSYEHFLEDLSDLVADHFGGERGSVSHDDDDWMIAFRINECVPDDGGIFKDYDTDVTWKNGVEL